MTGVGWHRTQWGWVGRRRTTPQDAAPGTVCDRSRHRPSRGRQAGAPTSEIAVRNGMRVSSVGNADITNAKPTAARLASRGSGAHRAGASALAADRGTTVAHEPDFDVMRLHMACAAAT
jgi:hypothetical protein